MAVPSQHTQPCRPDESLADNARCLLYGLIPMPEDEPRRIVEKVIALLLVGVWSAVFLGLSFDAVSVSTPQYWAIFTAIVFTLVGKLWDLEVDKYLPGGSKRSNDSRGED